MKPIRLGRAFLAVGVWTMVSRVLGFVRDILIAATLGAGPMAEAFLVAFALPNMFRRVFAEGAFNMAFVPMFSKRYQAGQNAEDFARDAFSALAAMLIVLTGIALFAMPWLVLAMASGFLGDQRFDLAVDYGRIAFPYILFISLAALLSGVLNATGRFVAAAAAPVLLNILFIGAVVVAVRAGWPVGRALIWSVPVAGMAQLALVWVAAARAGFRIVPRRPRWTPELRRLAIIAAPAALAGGVVQINLLVGRQVASFTDGAIAWLSYADRLYQLPLGVVGVAIGIVLLPDLSRKLSADDTDGGRAALNRAAEWALALTLPAAAALMVIPGPLVKVLFQRGAFDAGDTAATAAALVIYGAGLPAFVLHKVLQPLYFAREDTKRPFYYALAALVINAGLAIGLMPVVGYLAAAIGATAAAWGMVLLLWLGARRMGPAARPDARLLRRVPRILLASAIMALALVAANRLLAAWYDQPLLDNAAILILVAIGFVTYAVAAQVTGGLRLNEFLAGLRRNR